MTKQKRGLLLFLTSLIPGAGQMYMGFRKRGLSIMLLFFALFAFSAATFGFSWMIIFLPVIWFYSFFDVHNLKSLPEEDFYAIEDSYILNLDGVLGDSKSLLGKYRTLTAVVLILIGAIILWNNLMDAFYWFLPDWIAMRLMNLFRLLPQIVIAVGIILAGVYIIKDKKEKLDEAEASEEDEHYWEPYRPYQQPKNMDPSNTQDAPEMTDAPKEEGDTDENP